MRILDQPSRYSRSYRRARRWRKPDPEDLPEWLVDFWWNGRAVRGNAWFSLRSAS